MCTITLILKLRCFIHRAKCFIYLHLLLIIEAKKIFIFAKCRINNANIECFHMTSRRPYWCPKTMKRQPCWCPKPIRWELNSFLMQTLSFVSINLHRCWPREWKHSIHSITPRSTSLTSRNIQERNLHVYKCSIVSTNKQEHLSVEIYAGVVTKMHQ